MKNQAKLKNLGLEGAERYYYLKYPKYNRGCPGYPDLPGYPSFGTATVCILPWGLSYARGVAFCNPKDQFNRRLGRAIALGRAVKALEHFCSSDSIPYGEPVSILIYRLDWEFLSCWNPVLTNFERKLFEGRTPKDGAI